MDPAKIQSTYAFLAPLYDLCVDRVFHLDRLRVIQALELEPGERVLELGVGTGLNLPFYPRGANVVGIDLSRSMIERAQGKGGAGLALMDAERIGLRGNAFDKALATYVLRVIPSPREALREISRVVRPGGRLVLLDLFSSKALVRALSEPLRRRLGSGKDYVLSDLLRETPWRLVSQKPLGRIPNTRLVILRNGVKTP